MMDTATWPQSQEMALGGTKNLDEMVSSSSCSSRPMLQEKKVRPHKEQALNCPRCNSTNTKFCYYNNYSLSQPRYFCKTCRRYWTEGGSLRNVPVGGGSRKNKRSITKKLSDLAAPNSSSLDTSSVLNQRNHDGKDLNLGMFPTINQMGLPTSGILEYDQNPFSSSSSSLTALDLMRSSGFVTRSLMSSFAPVQDPNHYGASGFGMNDFRSLSLDGFSNYGNLQGVSDNRKLSIAFEDVKPAAAHHLDLDQNRSQVEASGYWGGILGGAPWPQVPNYGL